MLSVVLPAHNESAALEDLLSRIGQGAPGDYQILVVDDGSTDETAAIARRIAARLPVRVLTHATNLGYGRALATGLREGAIAGGTVVTLDADDSHDPALITAMLNRIEAGSDLVIASRFVSGGGEIGVPPHRRLLSHGASHVLRTAMGTVALRDFTSGYRAYRASLLRRMIQAYGNDGFVREVGFAAGLELLLKAIALDARIAEVPLVLRYDLKRSASKLRVPSTLFRTFAVLASLGPRARLGGSRRVVSETGP